MGKNGGSLNLIPLLYFSSFKHDLFLCTPWQYYRIHGLDLRKSSVTTGMRGAKAGVSPPRRSLTCMQYDFASFGVRYEIIPVQACHIILTWRHVERCGIPDTPSRVNKHLYLYPGYLYISLPVPWVLCQGRTLLTIYSGRVLMLHMTHNMIGYVFV